MREAEHGGELQRQVTNAASKVSLLKREVLFSETMVTTLVKIVGLRHSLGLIEVSMQSDNFWMLSHYLRRLKMNLGTWEWFQERRSLVSYRRIRKIFATVSLRVYQVVGMHCYMLTLNF